MDTSANLFSIVAIYWIIFKYQSILSDLAIFRPTTRSAHKAALH